jgi:hypothetical protein
MTPTPKWGHKRLCKKRFKNEVNLQYETGKQIRVIRVRYFLRNSSTKGEKTTIGYIPVYRKGFI